MIKSLQICNFNNFFTKELFTNNVFITSAGVVLGLKAKETLTDIFYDVQQKVRNECVFKEGITKDAVLFTVRLVNNHSKLRVALIESAASIFSLSVAVGLPLYAYFDEQSCYEEVLTRELL